MKKQFLKLSLVLLGLIIVSCSGDESTESPENSNEESIEFIATITKQNPEEWEKPTQFIYENGRLKYIYLDDCSGELYYFEYTNDGKISKSYQQAYISFEGETFNASSFDLMAFKNDSNTRILSYFYEGEKLMTIQKDENFIDYQFTYYSDGTLQTAEWFIEGIGLWEKVTFEYSGGKISKLNKKEYDTSGGTVNSDYNYTFQFDDNPNPFYNLVESYNLLFQYTCTGFDYISSEDMGLKLFKNNIKKVFRDGVEIYSATYQYDDNNYPTSVSFTNTVSETSGVLLLSYLK